MNIMINGQEYNLAKKNMKIARLQETAEASKTITEAYNNEFTFVRAAIGDEAVRAILGSISIEDIDLNELVMVYNDIVTEYDKEINAAAREKEYEMFSSPAFDKISALAADIRTITDLEKGYKKK